MNIADLELINVDQFKELPKSEKKEYLREIRKVFSDNEIRTYWDMKYAAFHYYLQVLELNKEPKDNVSTAPKNDAPSKPKNNNTAKSNRKFIEAEFSIVEDPARKQVAATMIATEPNHTYLEVPEKRKQTIETNTPIMNFPDTNGNVAQLRKKLEGILMILESEGEQVNFQMKIQVFQK